jgi:predicted nucleic acid-binding protein
VRFWDASGLLPLLLEEPRSERMKVLYDEDHAQSVWCLTEIEIASALARRVREGTSVVSAESARKQSGWLAQHWTEIGSVVPVRSRALRLLNTHALRAADALQLAAALVACDERPDSFPFVCLDDRLREAARKEGFPVLPA